ncbi:DUF6959 family protein [Streptomyces sp. NPDC059499]|uniref:DUF6959 family protein n=1 Tax=Streptomyces sp. NPDC059499 TaxID=3346852 RepID=UPI0036A07C4D
MGIELKTMQGEFKSGLYRRRIATPLVSLASEGLSSSPTVEPLPLTDGGNNAVVRLPPRRFPGVLIEGDSLSIIRGEVAEVIEACDQGELAGARETADQDGADVASRLSARRTRPQEAKAL